MGRKTKSSGREKDNIKSRKIEKRVTKNQKQISEESFDEEEEDIIISQKKIKSKQQFKSRKDEDSSFENDQEEDDDDQSQDLLEEEGEEDEENSDFEENERENNTIKKKKNTKKTASKKIVKDKENSSNKRVKKDTTSTSNRKPTSVPNYKDLISYIEKWCPSNFRSKINSNGKLFNNVTNLGARSGDLVVMGRPGEYEGLGVIVLDDMKPLATDSRMLNALRMISEDNEDLPSSIRQLSIQQETQQFGINLLFYAIKIWLKSIKAPSCLQLEQLDLKEYEENDELEEFRNHFKKIKHTPLSSRLRIAQIGQSKKGNPVVPEDWMGREFENGEELHREMDKLDWRRGKPAITYCCTYGAMNHLEKRRWKTIKEAIQSKDKKVDVICRIHRKLEEDEEEESSKESQFVHSKCWDIKSDEEMKQILGKFKDNEEVLVGEFKENKIMIVCNRSSFFKDVSEYEKKEENCGVLVSRIQKSIRRGRQAPKVLAQSIEQLCQMPPYNLADQQFVRVSANRQLLWRLFISCIEDSNLYLSNEGQKKILSLQSMVILSLICQFDTDLQLNEMTLQNIKITALHIQKDDKRAYNWRKGDSNKLPNLSMNSIGIKRIDNVMNPFRLALLFSPMMSGDLKMLKMHLNYLQQNVNQNFQALASKLTQTKEKKDPKSKKQKQEQNTSLNQILSLVHLQEFEEYFKNEDKFFSNSDESVENLVKLSSIDMHCHPAIILQLQSSLPFYPQSEFSTQKVSSFIWDASSSFNIRYSKSDLHLSELKSQALKALREIQNSYQNTENDEADLAFNQKIQDLYVNKQSQCNFKPGKEGDELVGRNAFLSLFGKKQRVLLSNKTVDVIICGDKYKACKAKRLAAGNQMKYLEEDERQQAEDAFFKDLNKGIEINQPDPPVGYEWIYSNQNKKGKVLISGKVLPNDELKYEFSVNKIFKISTPFDARSLLKPLPYPQEINCNKNWRNLILQSMYVNNIEDFQKYSSYELLKVLKVISQIRLEQKDFQVIDAKSVISEIEQISTSVIWKHLLVKLHSDEHQIIIGPVDRSGKKLQHSISYLYEGSLFRFFSLLSALYPRVIIHTSANSLKFNIQRKVPEYLHMLDFIKFFTTSGYQLSEEIGEESEVSEFIEEVKENDAQDNAIKESLIIEGKRKRTQLKYNLQESDEEDNVIESDFEQEKQPCKSEQMEEEVEEEEELDSNIEQELQEKSDTQQKSKLKKIDVKEEKEIDEVRITSKLWEHQESTVERITDGILKWGKKGFGDASCVGAGKTLTALAVLQKIYIHSKNQRENGFSGFLILIPSIQLFETWLTEIKKHSSGFRVIIQNSDGSLKPRVNNFNRCDILISTLARIRDHPIYSSWKMVVIDECLSIQRREALQTEEAWRQVLISEHGVLMMSATFFRSRFDQLFFMLKILRSGIPETKDYLDTILNESMVCFIGDNGRKWNMNVTRFELNDELKQRYESLKQSNLINNTSSQNLYNILADFLFKKYSIIKDLKNHVKNLESQGCKILIFSRSKQEADEFAEKIPHVSRFPDLSDLHVSISYAEGTYGLNTLVKYNTLLTRPPEPDKLPQMKGRLDRPGQQSQEIRLEFILVGNTIEEAWLLRLEVAKKFMSDYIMPLAQFYDAAVGY